ncbi:hypothetical protein MJ572_04085 [Escherichia coli]|nr:hypothetical protein MJ572_04085 [Escherichia coli]
METGEGNELFRKHLWSRFCVTSYCVAAGSTNYVQRSDGPAQVFCHPDYAGEIGLIMPYREKASAPRSRLRVSSIGKLHLCLFGEGGVNLRDLLEDDTQQQALEARISAALREKSKDPISCIKQRNCYAKLIVHWRLNVKERSDESGKH